MDDKKITLTVAEFRKQVKMALDFCVEGGTIEIERMGQHFILAYVPRGVSVAIGKLALPKKPKLEPIAPAKPLEVNPKSHGPTISKKPTFAEIQAGKKKNGPR